MSSGNNNHRASARLGQKFHSFTSKSCKRPYLDLSDAGETYLGVEGSKFRGVGGWGEFRNNFRQDYVETMSDRVEKLQRDGVDK